MQQIFSDGFYLDQRSDLPEHILRSGGVVTGCTPWFLTKLQEWAFCLVAQGLAILTVPVASWPTHNLQRASVIPSGSRVPLSPSCCCSLASTRFSVSSQTPALRPDFEGFPERTRWSAHRPVGFSYFDEPGGSGPGSEHARRLRRVYSCTRGSLRR